MLVTLWTIQFQNVLLHLLYVKSSKPDRQTVRRATGEKGASIFAENGRNFPSAQSWRSNNRRPGDKHGVARGRHVIARLAFRGTSVRYDR